MWWNGAVLDFLPDKRNFASKIVTKVVSQLWCGVVVRQKIVAFHFTQGVKGATSRYFR